MIRNTPFDELFERMNRGFGGMEMDAMSASTFAVDVKDAEDAVVVTADLPGFDREDIDVSVSGRTLSLRASRAHETSDEPDGTYVRRERRHESVSRSVRLPADVDEEAASATYRNGVLSVRMPRHEVGDDASHIDVE